MFDHQSCLQQTSVVQLQQQSLLKQFYWTQGCRLIELGRRLWLVPSTECSCILTAVRDPSLFLQSHTWRFKEDISLGVVQNEPCSPELQQLHLGGVMLWYSVYSSLTSFYSEEILWRWLISELEQVHSNLLLLLREPRGPCREESSDVEFSTVQHTNSQKRAFNRKRTKLWLGV